MTVIPELPSSLDTVSGLPTINQTQLDDPEGLCRRADRFLLVGALLTGSLILGPIGVPVLIYGLHLLRRAERSGVKIRPWPITIVGLICGLDCTANMMGWGIDVFAHQTGLDYAMWAKAYGPLVDGAYYIHYNLLAVGGSGNLAEKSIEIFSVCFVFPLRMVSAWGFVKMKRWGLPYMIMTSWLYVGVWLMYMMNITLDFQNRLGASRFGIAGWWALNGFFVSAFIFLPYLYTLKQSQWNRK